MSVLVSVVTITYNSINAGRKEFLRQCFESVHNQTYGNIEHIVIDGASTDGTVELIREYADKGWLTYYSEPDKGIYDAMNKGIEKAAGKYIAFLNSDDFWHDPRGVEESVNCLEKEQADFSYATCYYLDENENCMGCLTPQIGSFYSRMPFSHQTMFTRREKMLELGKFDDSFKSAADYDFVYRLILSGAKGVHVPLNFTTYRFIGISSVQADASEKECEKILERIFSQYVFSKEDSHNCWNYRPKKEFVEKIKNDVDSTICCEVEKILALCPVDKKGYYYDAFIPLIKKIKVVYDATLLENLYKKNNVQTGIIFVAYNVLAELLKRPELEVYAYCEKHAEKALMQVIADNKEKFSQLKMYTGNMADFDIFFSPVFKIPDKIRKTGICCFTFIHDLIPILFPLLQKDAAEENSWYMQMMNALTYEDYIFTSSDCTKHDTLKTLKKLDSAKVTTALLAANNTFYQDMDEEKHRAIRKKYTIPLDKKYIFSLCTVEPRKNLIFTVKNFVEFIKKNQIEDLVFVLGGGAWEAFTEQLDAEIDNLALYKAKIIKIGHIDDCDLASLYSHALCSPYMSLYEGFALPPLEAMQCGCPVITSNTSSLPEIVGDAGIMLDPHDNEGMIKAYETIYYDEKYRTQLTEKSLEQAKRFSWEKTVDVIVQNFMNVNTNENKCYFDRFIKVLGFLPLFSVIHEYNKVSYKILSFIPLLVLRKNKNRNKITFRLFDFIPFLAVKKTYTEKTVFLFGIKMYTHK